MNLIEDLKWRYATKRMNGEDIPIEKLNVIMEAIRFAPTSMGLQPFKVLIVKDKTIREKMKSVCYNQPQITESALMLVFAVWKDGYEEKTEEFIQLIADTRKQTIESLAEFKNRIFGFLPKVDKVAWATRQAYIAFGFGLAAAAMLKVDSTPMEGFISDELDKVLGLEKLGLKSVVIMAIGNRDEAKDYLVSLPKVRKPKEDFFINY
jgi:nitroreductase